MRTSFIAPVAALVVSAALLAPREAIAWDGIQSGRVADIEVYGDGSFSLSLVDVPNLCPVNAWPAHGTVAGNGPVPATADGKKALYVAALSAKLAGKQVVIYSMNNATGPCWIGVINVSEQ
jgi:hypothetical protein